MIVPEADITTRRVGSLTSLTHRTALRGGESSNTASAQLGTYRWFFPPTESDLSTPQVTIVAPDSVTVQAVVGSTNFVFDERELQLQLRDVFEARLGEAHTLRLGADVVASRFELDASSTNPVRRLHRDRRREHRSLGRASSPSATFPRTCGCSATRWTPGPRRWTSRRRSGAPSWRTAGASPPRSPSTWACAGTTTTSPRAGRATPTSTTSSRGRASTGTPTPRSVVRGGAGIYTGRLPYAVYSDAVQFGPGGNAVVTLEGGALPAAALPGGAPALRAWRRSRRASRRARSGRTFARGLEQPYSVAGHAGVPAAAGGGVGASRWTPCGSRRTTSRARGT